MEEPPNGSNENGSERASAFASFPTTNGRCESFREELSRLLYKPLPQFQSNKLKGAGFSLSVLPWRISGNDFTAVARSPNSLERTRTSSTSDPFKDSLYFPPVSYLDLRRHQNLSFADSQCRKAQEEVNENPKASNPRKLWKQALQLVPDHFPSLVGYGRYLLDNGELDASEDLLKQSLTIEPKNAVAENLLSELARRRRMSSQKRNILLSTSFVNMRHTKTNNVTARKSSAYQDALLERRLLDSPHDNSNVDAAINEDSDSHRQTSRDRKEDRKRKRERRERRKRKRKEHRRNKKRKRHRRRRYYSSDESSRSSTGDNSDSSFHSSKGSHASSDSSASRPALGEEPPPVRETIYETSLHASDKKEKIPRNKRRKRRRRDEDDRRHRSRSKNRERRHHRKEQKGSKNYSSDG